MKNAKQLSTVDKLRVDNLQLEHENIALKIRLCQDELARLQTAGQEIGKKLVDLRTEFAGSYGMMAESITIRRDGLIEGESVEPVNATGEVAKA